MYNIKAFEEWCVELETTDKEQGVNSLCNGSKYCCLGILCSMLEERLSLLKTTSGSQVSWNNHSDTLPCRVYDYMGCTPNPRIGFKDHTSPIKSSVSITIAELNDKNRLTFKQIAKVIRAYFIDNVIFDDLESLLKYAKS